MNDWHDSTLASYKSKGFAERSGYGKRPALLIVDYIVGFTDPTTPLGGNFDSQLEATRQLLEQFRAGDLPIFYTTVQYEPGYADAGVFIEKVPSLSILVEGSPMVEVDERIKPATNDHLIIKKYASSFFGTNLDTHLKNNGVDTLIIVGCTTSGCVRASAVDSLQYGYRTIVVREGCGDRAEGPHEANLFDLDAKYADVVNLDECLSAIQTITATREAS